MQFTIFPLNSSTHSNFPIKRKNKNFVIMTMASLLSLSLISVLLFFSVSGANSSHNHRRSHTSQPSKPGLKPLLAPKPSTPGIQAACKATRYPSQCESQLSSQTLSSPSSPLQIIQSSLSVSSQNLKTAVSMVHKILSVSSHSLNRSLAAQTCLEVLNYSDFRTQSTADALSRFKSKDARAWASAALCYQYDCWSGLKYVNDSHFVGETMAFINNTLLVSTSNALSMMVAYDVFGNKTESWAPPKTERNGFWEISGGSGSELGFAGGFPSGLKPDATVCKGGKEQGCYETVQAAVDLAPGEMAGKKFVIFIKEGVYEETVRVGLDKKNVVFVGEGIGKTVITGSINTGLHGITTYNTATVGVLGDGFMAKDLTIQNTAGPGAHQAVAFRSDSDLSYIENVEFLGNQDTLYVHSLRQLYKSCHIEGNVDFIFGNAAAVFQNCTILIRPRQDSPEKGGQNPLSAHGRTDPAQSSGFAFLSCYINGTDEFMKLYRVNPQVHKNYLGRPWKEFSRTVFIDCTIGDLIAPEGWSPWSGDFALSTLYYGEFQNKGPGADLSKRVKWSSQIPAEHIGTYSVYNFIQGEEFSTSLSRFRKKVRTSRRIPHVVLY